jgi:hypothetical protein
MTLGKLATMNLRFLICKMGKIMFCHTSLQKDQEKGKLFINSNVLNAFWHLSHPACKRATQ